MREGEWEGTAEERLSASEVSVKLSDVEIASEGGEGCNSSDDVSGSTSVADALLRTVLTRTVEKVPMSGSSRGEDDGKMGLETDSTMASVKDDIGSLVKADAAPDIATT